MKRPDHTPLHGRRLTIRTAAAGPHAKISVIDNGPGMRPEILEKIFKPLFTTKSSGVGLGLPTVQKLVEQHGGTIDVISAVGEGTTFTTWLPRHSASKKEEPDKAAASIDAA